MKSSLFESFKKYVRRQNAARKAYASYHNTPMYHPSQIEAGQKFVDATKKIMFKKDDAGYRKQIRSVSNQIKQQKFQKQRSTIPINHDLSDRLKQHIAAKKKQSNS